MCGFIKPNLSLITLSKLCKLCGFVIRKIGSGLLVDGRRSQFITTGTLDAGIDRIWYFGRSQIRTWFSWPNRILKT